MLDVLREMDHDNRILAFIRHSERGRRTPSMDHVPLTPRGVELAHRFGRELPDFGHASLSHSSIIRSIQTAEEIDSGFRESHPQSRLVLAGKDPIFSVIYRGTIDKNLRDGYRAGLRDQAFIQMWLNGEVPGTIMRPAKETIDRFLWDVETRIRMAPSRSFRIHVGHDREIEVV